MMVDVMDYLHGGCHGLLIWWMPWTIYIMDAMVYLDSNECHGLLT